MTYTKVQDFARDCGVTDRAVQKHVKRLEKELAGHIERRGANGTWLDDEACAIIRSHMITPPPPVVGDRNLVEENAALKDKVLALQDKLLIAQEMIGQQQQQLVAAQQEHLLLEAARTKTAELEQDLAVTRQQAADATQRANNAEASAVAAAAALEAEQHRKLSFRERLFGRKE